MTPTYIIINGRYVRVTLTPRAYRVFNCRSIATGEIYIRSVSVITYDFAHRLTDGQSV